MIRMDSMADARQWRATRYMGHMGERLLRYLVILVSHPWMGDCRHDQFLA